MFGPVLHLLRYRRTAQQELIDAINATGYGLTLGVHSRIDETIDAIVERARVGNQYVNRNMIGAVVGVQPFGGDGLSGTGPKAGGPLYLRRLLSDPPGARGMDQPAAAEPAASAVRADLLAPLIAQLRALPGLVERTPGTFYYRSSAFLHFHEDPAGLFADAKLNFKLFERHRVSTRAEQSALFKAVAGSLTGAPLTNR